MSQDQDLPIDVDTSEGSTEVVERIFYYLNLRLASKTHEKPDFPLPSAISQILELGKSLPKPEYSAWAALAADKLPALAKAKKAAGEGTAQRAEKLNDEQKQELVRLVEDEDFRMETMGKEGTHQGHVNWTGLARRYGFVTPAPIHRQYQMITGKDPPGITKKEKKEGAATGEPSAKKQKVKETPAPAPPAPAANADGWTTDERNELVKLVEDEEYRKEVFNKRSLKWGRIAEHLEKGKKECKRKYTEITGKGIDSD